MYKISDSKERNIQHMERTEHLDSIRLITEKDDVQLADIIRKIILFSDSTLFSDRKKAPTPEPFPT